MKKTILFVILEQFSDWESAYLASALNLVSPGKYTVKTVSLTKECVSSIGGFRVIPDFDIQSAPAEYEGLILVGGLSWRNENAKQVKTLVQKALDSKKVVGGICDAAGFLATIGVLNQINHTGNDVEDIKQWAGGAYTGEASFLREQAVRDHNIVTANGTAPLEFGREVLFALGAATEFKILEWYNFHKLGCYNAPLSSM